jgi:hypothetical protein
MKWRKWKEVKGKVQRAERDDSAPVEVVPRPGKIVEFAD